MRRGSSEGLLHTGDETGEICSLPQGEKACRFPLMFPNVVPLGGWELCSPLDQWAKRKGSSGQGGRGSYVRRSAAEL